MKPFLPGLYAIADVDTLRRRGLDVVSAALALVAGGPAILQLRAKCESAAGTLALLRALRGPTRAAGILLFANDRADLARAAECDGVHVGQDDLPLEEVRRSFPELRVGVSTHNEAQLEAALALCPDYVALGPIFATGSKENPDPVVGLDLLEKSFARASEAQVPLVAIGGIDERSASTVAQIGASAALIGALMPESASSELRAYEEITRRTTQFAALFAAK